MTVYSLIESLDIQALIANFMNINIQVEKIIFYGLKLSKAFDRDHSFVTYFTKIGKIYLKGVMNMLTEQESCSQRFKNRQQYQQQIQNKAYNLILFYFKEAQFLSLQSKH